MNSEFLVVVLALVLALAMAIKPEMFIINPKHKSWRFERGIRYIGMSVSIVFLVWIIATLLRR